MVGFVLLLELQFVYATVVGGEAAKEELAWYDRREREVGGLE